MRVLSVLSRQGVWRRPLIECSVKYETAMRPGLQVCICVTRAQVRFPLFPAGASGQRRWCIMAASKEGTW